MTNDHALATRVSHAILETAASTNVRSAPWKRDLTTGDDALACAFCLAPLNSSSRATYLSWLVAPYFGGPLFSDNTLLTCRHCANARDNMDVLGWPAFQSLGSPDSRAQVLALRARVLTASANHMTHTSRWTQKQKVFDALASRWEHPRIKLFAFHGATQSFIGWTARCGAPGALGSAAGILRYGFQATPLTDFAATLFAVPSSVFLDAIWELIEHGALVVPVDLENEPVAELDPDDWRSWWSITFTDPADIRRRRPRLAGNQAKVPGTLAHQVMRLRNQAKRAGQVLPDDIDARRHLAPAPRKPRQLATQSSAVHAREKYRRGVEAQRTRVWLEARAALDDYKQRVRDGRARPATLDEQFLMENEVLDLFDAIKRW